MPPFLSRSAAPGTPGAHTFIVARPIESFLASEPSQVLLAMCGADPHRPHFCEDRVDGAGSARSRIQQDCACQACGQP